VPRLIVEFGPPIEDAPPPLSHDTAPLVYFLSFAFSARYGAQHDLSKASMLLRGGEHKIDLKPLLTFADRDVEDPADDKELARVWQDAAPLAECCQRVVEAIDADPAIRVLLSDFPTLRDRIAELGEIASFAVAQESRIRLTYTMG
jgi:hypothetical protein